MVVVVRGGVGGAVSVWCGVRVWRVWGVSVVCGGGVVVVVVVVCGV